MGCRFTDGFSTNASSLSSPTFRKVETGSLAQNWINVAVAHPLEPHILRRHRRSPNSPSEMLGNIGHLRSGVVPWRLPQEQ
jgi:hypothetical protein